MMNLKKLIHLNLNGQVIAMSYFLVILITLNMQKNLNMLGYHLLEL